MRTEENRREPKRTAMLVKIYRIVNNVDDVCYVGGTRQPLNKRWNEHVSHYRKGDKALSSRHILDKYGLENCSIVLITEIEVENTEHQRRIEREYYEMYNGINSRRPHITCEERSVNRKNYDAIHNAIKAKSTICECGASITIGCKSRHLRTKTHDKRMNALIKDDAETQQTN